MPDKQLFEYAVIRIVPRVEREEFINVGVVMYVRSKRFLQTMICLDEQRLQILFPGADAGMITTYLVAFQQICQATPGSGPIGKLDTASRFRWLTATRSTVVQTSKVHPGMCAEPETALQRLYEQLVR